MHGTGEVIKRTVGKDRKTVEIVSTKEASYTTGGGYLDPGGHWTNPPGGHWTDPGDHRLQKRSPKVLSIIGKMLSSLGKVWSASGPVLKTGGKVWKKQGKINPLFPIGGG